MDIRDELLDRKEAARLLRVSPRTVDRIAQLPRIRVGCRRILFRRGDLDAYLEARTDPRAA